MPNSSFFRSLGIFVLDGFFDPELCRQVRSDMRGAESGKATVVKEGQEGVLDETTRKVLGVKVTRSLSDLVRQRLLDLTPKLENHFHVRLTGYQGPDFLRYSQGAFYRPHKDARDGDPPSIRKRRISAIVFLNSHRKEPAEDTESYGGGSLALYGLLDGPEWEKCGFSLEPEQGALIAFRSDVLHEVQPVTFGERYSIVGWFTSNDLPQDSLDSTPPNL